MAAVSGAKHRQLWIKEGDEPRAYYTDNDGVDYDIENLIDALDHIMRVTRQASTMTKRLKFIELRAKSALENTDDWREYDYPTNREPTMKRLRVRAQEAEANVEKLKAILYGAAKGQGFWEDDVDFMLEEAGLLAPSQ